jgi:mannose-1-phosphate guanylyltransferase/mannose-6-phosphate isomerase
MAFNNAVYNVTPFILCGGSGTRLWLLSRSAFLKQFLVLYANTTLFQQAIDRLQHLKNPSIKLNDLLIATNEEHRFLVLDQLREINDVKAKLLLEPVARNTALALTLDTLEARCNEGDPTLEVTPADQTVQDQDAFSRKGDANMAKLKLGWTPKINCKELLAQMACADLESAQSIKLAKNARN